MQLYGLKTCDSTRLALKTLREAGQEVAYIDVRNDGMPADLLTKFLTIFGEKLVNKRSTTWRGLSDSERAGDSLALLLAHPTLMKRPVIRVGEDIYLGWGKDVQMALIR
ncbi:arsenate reductase [Rhodobacterales bacterium 52_120_T64]|nr:arsenate reductase [Rhodobacterales bacterium 52_120_T64]